MRIIVVMLLIASTVFGAKVKRTLQVNINCGNVAPGATNALSAEKKVGTTDDAAMEKRVTFNNHPLTSGQATALGNLCDAIDNAMGL